MAYVGHPSGREHYISCLQGKHTVHSAPVETLQESPKGSTRRYFFRFNALDRCPKWRYEIAGLTPADRTDFPPEVKRYYAL